jgi:hypothetical protein
MRNIDDKEPWQFGLILSRGKRPFCAIFAYHLWRLVMAVPAAGADGSAQLGVRLSTALVVYIATSSAAATERQRISLLPWTFGRAFKSEVAGIGSLARSNATNAS